MEPLLHLLIEPQGIEMSYFNSNSAYIGLLIEPQGIEMVLSTVGDDAPSSFNRTTRN